MLRLYRHARILGGPIILLCGALVAGCTARIGDPPILDPAFAGTWTAAEITVIIGHERGLIEVVGFNERPGSAWQSIALTGQVTRPDRAEVSGDLWASDPDTPPVQLSSVEAELVKFGSVLDLSLSYAVAGAPRTELITLARLAP